MALGSNRRPMSGALSPRRRQRGVAAVELLLGLPILILVVGSMVTVGRLAHTKIKLDGFTDQAVRECALDTAVTTVEQAQECVLNLLTNARLSACQEIVPRATINEFVSAYVDPETGDALEAAVPLMRVSVECNVETLRVGNFIPNTVLTAVASAGRN